jgi:hypothetical protein
VVCCVLATAGLWASWLGEVEGKYVLVSRGSWCPPVEGLITFLLICARKLVQTSGAFSAQQTRRLPRQNSLFHQSKVPGSVAKSASALHSTFYIFCSTSICSKMSRGVPLRVYMFTCVLHACLHLPVCLFMYGRSCVWYSIRCESSRTCSPRAGLLLANSKYLLWYSIQYTAVGTRSLAQVACMFNAGVEHNQPLNETRIKLHQHQQGIQTRKQCFKNLNKRRVSKV